MKELRKIKQMKRRILAMLLCFAMVLNINPTIPLLAFANGDVSVTCDGKAVKEIELPQNERKELTANQEILGDGDYQWQILAYDSVWVDIAGAEGENLVLSYAMVANLLDDDTATVRCKVTNGDTVAYSSEVSVAIDYTVELEETKTVTTAASTTSTTVKSSGSSDYQTASGSNAVKATDSDASDSNADASEESTTEASTGILSGLVHKVTSFISSRSSGVMALSDDGTTAKYTITIDYVYEDSYEYDDGEQAYESWVAELDAETSYSATVKLPEIVGYLAYDEEGIAVTEVELDYPNGLTEDVTINISYKPTTVNYTVIYYQQNVEDDGYTEYERASLDGVTGSEISDIDKEYDGFYALLYEKTTIAADGSTVVEVYYDRYYYLMTFELYGGYGTEPIYARYGAALGTVNDPTLPGYTFSGWASSDGSTDSITLPITMPAENKIYYAIWTTGTTAYTVVYWLENPNDESYSYLGAVKGNAEPGALVSGSDSAVANDIITEEEMKYYTYNSEMTDANVSVNADGSSVVNVYYDRNEYTLKFYYMRSYTNTDKWGNTTTVYQVPTETGNSSSQNGTVASATWQNVDFEVEFKTTIYDKTKGIETISDYKYYYFTITAKFGQDITSIWPNAPFKAIAINNSNKKYNFVSWGTHYGSGYYEKNTNKNIKGPYSILDKMLLIDASVTSSEGINHWMVSYWNTEPTMYIYNIYYSLLDGETGEKIYDGVSYKYQQNYEVGSTDNPDKQSALSFEGVTFVAMDTENSKKEDNAPIYFYYQRNAHTLTFDDQYGTLEEKNLVYGQSISSFADYIPAYPASLEPNAYTFDGWFKDPTCTVAADFTITMPDENLVFYAKWIPTTHTVKFYLDFDAYTDDLPLETNNGYDYSTKTVSHGEMIDVPNPTNGGYTFIGWFYQEDGVEKAFDFANMPVKKDLDVYGKWTANVLIEYTIKYMYEGIEIADQTTGSSLAGMTKTFEAKGGTELYTGYQEGYFPLYVSHSLTMDITKKEVGMEYIFEYVHRDAVPYLVYYVDEEGNTLHAAKYVSDNKKAVVTENYEKISGYLPDAYQKRLVVTGASTDYTVEINGENVTVHPSNIITFVYTKDDMHAIYTITHYTENLDGSWYEYSSSYFTGDIGTKYSATAITIEGFTYDPNNENDLTAETELTSDGINFKLYYTRNSYPYVVKYLEFGTNKELADQKKANDGNYLYDLYEKVIDEEAIAIKGYSLVSSDPDPAEIKIQIEEGDEPVKNVIIFYYKRALADLKITKTFADGTTSSDETFIFKVVGNTNENTYYATINGAGSVTLKDLPVDTYTVSEQSDWSWRYEASYSESQSVMLDANKEIVVTNTCTKQKWIDGSTWCQNLFRDGGIVQIPGNS